MQIPLLSVGDGDAEDVAVEGVDEDAVVGADDADADVDAAADCVALVDV